MIRKVISVFDVQAQTFAQPMFVAAMGVGVRMVADEVNRAADDNLLYRHPQDFRLFELGEWDDQSGVCKFHAQPVLVQDLSTFQVKAPGSPGGQRSL